MIENAAAEIIRALRDPNQIRFFDNLLFKWLTAEDSKQAGGQTSFSENQARELLLTTQFMDEATLQDFSKLQESEAGARVATYELINESRLAAAEEVRSLVAVSTAQIISADDEPVSWLALSVASFAWDHGYPVDQFDPRTPPGPDSPAGHVLKRTAQFLRRQVQISATERDKLNRTLSQPPLEAPSLEVLKPDDGDVAPAPPHYRSPVPVRYPEMSTDTVRIEEDDLANVPTVEIGDPLVISTADITGDQNSGSELTRLPPMSIEAEQLSEETPSPPSPLPSTAVVTPAAPDQRRPGLSMSIRNMFSHESMTSAKLRVIVQHYPDGPGLYGLQVRVMSKGIKSYVAGTTNREGYFLCELPVRMQSGLTYDVQVTWPRDVGGDVEHKSITLNSDRTIFTMPFYRQINPPES